VSFHFASVLVFLVVACGFLAITLAIGKLLRPSTPTRMKGEVYECGEQALGGSWFNFNPRFYVVALVFLIFDVEIAFTYPVAVVFRRWIATGDGAVALLEIGAFIAVLALALGYVWRRGDLEWLRADLDAAPDAAATGAGRPLPGRE
jgi:NADH-quinone oxidoreductase subunit A